MKKNLIGDDIQRFIDRKYKRRRNLKITEVLETIEQWRIQLLLNAFDLYTMCENCGRDHKKNPTTGRKWGDGL